MKYSKANALPSFRLKYTKLFCLKSIFLLLISSCASGQSAEVQEINPTNALRLGSERTEVYLPQLRDQKIALVANQTSLVAGRHLLDTLLSLGLNVQKVFSPEHGFRGEANAGEHVATERDPETGLPIVSLYGKNKKPTAEQMKGLDAVLFDIQDVGVRFYTYISTLHYVMEACAENKVKLIVLDRPNPNGHYVDGPVLDSGFTSFVGMHPVPIVHGMTIGEYAQMINGEFWLKDSLQCALEVIACEGYTHAMPYSLPVRPSPNLRSDLAIRLYPGLCLLEATEVTVGRGTEGPFERYGHPAFPDSLPATFVPQPDFGAKDPSHKGIRCYGYDYQKLPLPAADKIDLQPLFNSYQLLKGDLFAGKSTRMFFLLCGTDSLLQQLQAGLEEAEIRASWSVALENYRNNIRPKYLIYPN
jgi:hypothetical protein